jgi:hypothetical protein
VVAAAIVLVATFLPGASLTFGSTTIRRTVYQMGPGGTMNWAGVVVLIGLALMAGTGLAKLRLVRLPAWISYPHPLIVYGGLGITLLGNLSAWPVKPFGVGVSMPAIHGAIGLGLIRIAFLLGLIACLAEVAATRRYLGGRYRALRTTWGGLLVLGALFISIGIFAMVNSSSSPEIGSGSPSGPRGVLLVLLAGLCLAASVPFARASRRQLVRRVARLNGPVKAGT